MIKQTANPPSFYKHVGKKEEKIVEEPVYQFKARELPGFVMERNKLEQLNEEEKKNREERVAKRKEELEKEQ